MGRTLSAYNFRWTEDQWKRVSREARNLGFEITEEELITVLPSRPKIRATEGTAVIHFLQAAHRLKNGNGKASTVAMSEEIEIFREESAAALPRESRLRVLMYSLSRVLRLNLI